MVKTRIYPHNMADTESVLFSAWWVQIGNTRSILEKTLRGWDYASSLTVGLDAKVNPMLLLESTGLPSIANTALLVMADCPAAQIRVAAKHLLPVKEDTFTEEVTLELPAGILAERVRLSAHLILAEPPANELFRVASTRGARLLSSPTQDLVLEDYASRFPVEPVSFTESDLSYAPWMIHFSPFDTLGDSFVGSVRLLVNEEHPLGMRLLDPEAALSVAPLAKSYVLRQIVAEFASRHMDDELSEGDFDEGSIGAVASAMCEFFLRASLESAISLYRDDPVQFEMLIEKELRPHEGLLT